MSTSTITQNLRSRVFLCSNTLLLTVVMHFSCHSILTAYTTLLHRCCCKS